MTLRQFESAERLARISGASPAMCALVFRAGDGDPIKVRLIRANPAPLTMTHSPRFWRLRHAVVVVGRDRLGLGFREIGLALNRDHSTAVHGYRVGHALLRRDPDFVQLCERIAP